MLEPVTLLEDQRLLIVGSFFFGLGGIVAGIYMYRRLMKEQRRIAAISLAAFMLTVSPAFCAFAVWYFFTYWDSPPSRIWLTADYIECHSWKTKVAWKDVEYIQFVYQGIFDRSIKVGLSPSALAGYEWNSAVQGRKAVNCQLDGLQLSAREAFDLIDHYLDSATNR